MTFLFLLTAGARSEAAGTVASLARAASSAGHRSEIFLAGDGVVHAAPLAGVAPVTLCEADRRWRQAGTQELDGVRQGSLRDFAQQVRQADRVLVFR